MVWLKRRLVGPCVGGWHSASSARPFLGRLFNLQKILVRSHVHFESWQKVFANGPGDTVKEKGWDALGRVRRWGCGWNGRQGDGSGCTLRFHKGLRVLARARGILSWFFTSGQTALLGAGCLVAYWQYLAEQREPLLRVAQAAGHSRHGPCPLIWQRNIHGGLGMGSRGFVERCLQHL